MKHYSWTNHLKCLSKEQSYKYEYYNNYYALVFLNHPLKYVTEENSEFVKGLQFLK